MTTTTTKMVTEAPTAAPRGDEVLDSGSETPKSEAEEVETVAVVEMVDLVDVVLPAVKYENVYFRQLSENDLIHTRQWAEFSKLVQG
jgi:hypothetical protein